MLVANLDVTNAMVNFVVQEICTMSKNHMNKENLHVHHVLGTTQPSEEVDSPGSTISTDTVDSRSEEHTSEL